MYSNYLKIYILVICVCGIGQSLTFVKNNEIDPDLLVQCNEGRVYGSRKQTFRKQLEFYAYEGIPYAEPPVDHLRFKDPIPIKSWRNLTLDATKERYGCLDSPFLAQSVLTNPLPTERSEDCLYLNVYIPKTGKSINLDPVIIWLHGGAFIGGSSNSKVYGPDYYLENDVIVVSVNYRLGIFGFLSTEDQACPGNMGLKDQHLAIKWTKDNIGNFGGDPEAITLAGQSAGAASAHYHMLAPKSKGLFRAVIAQSGTALNSWAYQNNARQIAFEAGNLLGIITQHSKELVDKMRRMDVEKIQAAEDTIFIMYVASSLGGVFGFAPVIEAQHPGAFITAVSYTACEKGNFTRVPLMTGVTCQEMGSFQNLLRIALPFLALVDIPQLSLLLKTFQFDSTSMKNEAIQILKNKYLRSGKFGDASIQEVTQYCSDDFFVRPAVKTAQLMSPYVPVYIYQMTYMGPSGLNSLSLTRRFVNGTSHAEDVFYLWTRRDLPVLTPEDGAFIDTLSTLWSNFVKYRTPTPKIDPKLSNIIWYPVNTSEVNYLNIGKRLVMGNKVDFINMDFWDKLIKKYIRQPYLTY